MSGLAEAMRRDLDHLKKLFSTFGIVSVLTAHPSDPAAVIITYSARWEAEKVSRRGSKVHSP